MSVSEEDDNREREARELRARYSGDPTPAWARGRAYRADDVAFCFEALQEVNRARAKFPAPDGLLPALFEECGEVARAMMDESPARVRAECVQVAAMALRLALEDDPTLASVREIHGSWKP